MKNITKQYFNYFLTVTQYQQLLENEYTYYNKKKMSSIHMAEFLPNLKLTLCLSILHNIVFLLGNISPKSTFTIIL